MTQTEEKKSTVTRYLITGLITLLPLWITLNILWYIFKIISGIFTPVLTPIFHIFFEAEESRFFGRLISFFVTLFIIWFIGALATNIAGRKLLIRLENLFIKLPLLRDIYTAVRKLTVYIFTKRQAFKKVVLVEYPRKGIYSIGFITAFTISEIQTKTKEEVINVFLPSTPNPTTGFLLMVPKRDIVELDMSVDDAMRLIITGGIITPDDKNVMHEYTGEE